jgi:hypothetical protein
VIDVLPTAVQALEVALSGLAGTADAVVQQRVSGGQAQIRRGENRREQETCESGPDGP